MNPDYALCRVMVLDDEPVVLHALAQIIRVKLGCAVVETSDSEHALRQLREESFDVLLADMVMPGLHGLELISKVHEQSPEVNIIAMTGFPDDFPYMEVINSGATDFIGKPCHSGELEAKLVRIFRERALLEARTLAEKKYRSLFELSMNGMLLVRRADWSISDANRAFCSTSGYSEEEVRGRPMFDFFEPAQRSRLEHGLTLFARGGCGALSDITLVPRAGQKRCMDVSVTFIADGSEECVLFMLRDVTESREIEREVLERAEKDDLTGLLSRRMFRTKVEAAVVASKTAGLPVSLLFVDVDNFKHCNDTYGHQTGDTLLATVGELLLKNIRHSTDDAFRYGGDEFAVLLKGAAKEVAGRIGERIRAQFEQLERYGTGLSIGVAQYSKEENGDGFIRAADNALYQAKAMGKNTVYVA